jgi:hypothetical protein
MRTGYAAAAAALVAALALSAPAAGIPGGPECGHHGCRAVAATERFSAYVGAHTGLLFRRLGCNRAGNGRDDCRVVSAGYLTCIVTGVVMEGKQGGFSVRSVSATGSCPKWHS